jgi:chaperone BCS1
MQGRVLIMTTNYPERLDSALIRPGRVDLQIKFTLATREQISEIFRRMYSTDDTVKSRINPQASDNNALMVARDGTRNTCKTCLHDHAPNTGSSTAVELRQERIAEMADQFAALLPNTTFSPAEIQGYLLLRKKDPAAALAGVKEWGEKVLEAKKQGKKVVDIN